MKFTQVTLSDDEEKFDAYTAETPEKWEPVYMTREQVVEFLNSTPYDYRLYGKSLLILMNEGVRLDSSPLCLDDGRILEGFYLGDVFEFVECESDPEPEEVELIASGYEWDCLKCERGNHEIEIKESVTCAECNTVYNVSDYHHAHK